MDGSDFHRAIIVRESCENCVFHHGLFLSVLPFLKFPSQLNDSAEDTDGKVGDFFVGIEMGLVHAGVGGDEGNSFGLFLDALHGGLVAID